LKALIVVYDGLEIVAGNMFRCGKESMKTQIDICKLESLRGNFVANLIMENLGKSANFNVSCPMKNNNIPLKITNLTFADQYIPTLVDFKACVDFSLKTMSKGEKKFVTVVQGRIWLRFKKNF
jgi:hypothetical protein